MKYFLVTCKCGWVHFQVDKKYVDKWEEDWKEFWKTLDDEGKKAYGVEAGPPSREHYLKCFCCGGSYKDFRDAKQGDCPEGCTIQPILDRSE